MVGGKKKKKKKKEEEEEEEEKKKQRGGKEEEEEGRGVWLMSTRCLTFGGSHILWSFSWCMICARTYVRRDA